MCELSFWGDENIPELESSMVAQHCECTKCHGIVHFSNGLNGRFGLCEFYHNKNN